MAVKIGKISSKKNSLSSICTFREVNFDSVQHLILGVFWLWFSVHFFAVVKARWFLTVPSQKKPIPSLVQLTYICRAQDNCCMNGKSLRNTNIEAP